MSKSRGEGERGEGRERGREEMAGRERGRGGKKDGFKRRALERNNT